jgi:hypothetical protein
MVSSTALLRLMRQALVLVYFKLHPLFLHRRLWLN